MILPKERGSQYMKKAKKNKYLITAILTGKGGSKLKNKNIFKINGKPLLSYPCTAAKKVKEINNYFVSSENKKILNLAEKYGYEKIVRPTALSMRNSLHKDVLVHAVKHLKRKNILPDILVVLLANSATIKTKWISQAIKLLKSHPKATACVPVIQDNDHHPFRAKKIDSNNYLKSFFKFKKKISSNRQDLIANFFLCHNFWVIKTKAIFRNNGEAPWNFLGKKVLHLKINYSIDIHDEKDIYLTQEWLKNN